MAGTGCMFNYIMCVRELINEPQTECHSIIIWNFLCCVSSVLVVCTIVDMQGQLHPTAFHCKAFFFFFESWEWRGDKTNAKAHVHFTCVVQFYGRLGRDRYYFSSISEDVHALTGIFMRGICYRFVQLIYNQPTCTLQDVISSSKGVDNYYHMHAYTHHLKNILGIMVYMYIDLIIYAQHQLM